MALIFETYKSLFSKQTVIFMVNLYFVTVIQMMNAFIHHLY